MLVWKIAQFCMQSAPDAIQNKSGSENSDSSLKVVLYKKNASFLINCPKMFFARFDIFNDLLFIQHNFFISI